MARQRLKYHEAGEEMKKGLLEMKNIEINGLRVSNLKYRNSINY